MKLKLLNGLRYEVETPSRLVFRLGVGQPPIVLEYNGCTWVMKIKEKSSFFLTRGDATRWLAEEIEKAEAKHEVCFNFAHKLKDDNR